MKSLFTFQSFPLVIIMALVIAGIVSLISVVFS
ncbi:hypothetical protein MNBD_GAMMA22-2012 [hydrothermal vent metagenome]|uniref:Uncharacterized protein n=1 Tax=hydrothermal vent metagenome TaxID=652676 RepID=A0A3B1ATP9_9ZZZZ